MSIMTQLASAIRSADLDIHDDISLPLSLTNIYACSVYRFDGSPAVHTFIAGDHTGLAVASLSDWCEMRHDFRPMRSSAKTPVRRLKMLDLIENPSAFEVALSNAKALSDASALKSLRMLPRWISDRTGVAMPEVIPSVGVRIADALIPSLARRLHRAAGC